MKINKGFATPSILITATIMVTTLLGLLTILAYQLDYSNRDLGSEKALNVAEAGINYYKWHLAHNPNDFKDGTVENGPYVHEYKDPQGKRIGEFSLQIQEPDAGLSVVTITSTGSTDDYPNIKRTIEAKYGLRSLADYSFLSNASSWYGEGSIVNGRVHSNNGIRMDGTNTSIVSSSRDTYKCGWETGCEPSEWKPGVWGSGGDQALWQFPVTPIDFDSISLDFADLKTNAQTDGIYLEPSDNFGYHLVFNGDEIVVTKITQTDWIKSYDIPGQGLGGQGEGGCRKRYEVITSETSVGNYQIENIDVIFVEDNVWVEGDVDTKITLAAASFPISSSYVDILIKGNLTYANYDGTNSLALIAQNNIIFTRDIPDYFNVDAILMAQKGKVIRYAYLNDCGGNDGAVKEKLTINGAVISYFKSYWNYNPGPESGFRQRVLSYDGNILFNPPPYFPTTGGYELISWEEK